MKKELKNITFLHLVNSINGMSNCEKRNDYIFLGLAMIEYFLFEAGHSNQSLENAVSALKQATKRELDEVNVSAINDISRFYWMEGE